MQAHIQTAASNTGLWLGLCPSLSKYNKNTTITNLRSIKNRSTARNRTIYCRSIENQIIARNGTIDCR
jgi:hypothetical protein